MVYGINTGKGIRNHAEPSVVKGRVLRQGTQQWTSEADKPSKASSAYLGMMCR